ncbi:MULTISPECIES: magnesium/cobalt transporter CorA [Micrococcaceae]|uniref:Magnesium transport protein CorA n=1 Tax=Paenarthrobacter aurescens (strain TC1) TaxID=290340 RepID=A1R8I0_PAEAT|nr:MULTISPECIES: magnesium/cobalt transporter CorA [Micrococcaceae]ABM06780.1 magnesium and cobalt transport protein CorA [Paenarthrobacter aurescens TC1]AFR29872.1 putative CorA-like metal ion (Mg2+/Co2+) transporter [Arthrobacter sp. Rue61a]MBP2265058.1 magnesium transporter [Pseudarthrobacter sp. PvP004]
MTIIDNAVYVDGVRTATPHNLEQTFEMLAEHGGMAWIGLYRPTKEEMAAVAQEFGLHELAVEDAVSAHQRPKLERYDHNLFTVLRPARYLDETETVEFGELHVFTGPNFVVTIRHAETGGVARVRKRLEERPDLLRHGPEAVLYALLDQVVDDYAPVVAGLENDIDEIEDQLFSGDSAVSRRIYELAREVIQFQRAIHPLPDMMVLLEKGFEKYGVDIELQRSLRDVEDHVQRVISRANSFRDLLQNALTLDGTLTANRQNEASAAQNEQVKKISSWAAILFAPSFVAGVYGMNFDHMPELHWEFGYPLAVGLMFGAALLMYVIFKRKGWL